MDEAEEWGEVKKVDEQIKQAEEDLAKRPSEIAGNTSWASDAPSTRHSSAIAASTVYMPVTCGGTV